GNNVGSVIRRIGQIASVLRNPSRDVSISTREFGDRGGRRPPQISVRTHFCYGVLGPPRSNQFLVADILHGRYEVTGISTEAPEHRADLAVVVQVVDKQGQVLFELPENVTSGDLVLGGSTL